MEPKEQDKEKFYSFSRGPLIMQEKTPYKIICNFCRKDHFLTLQDYQKQLDDTKSDGWKCPNCGKDDCTFDEVNYKNIMGVERRSF